MVGQGEVGGVTCRATCTWWLQERMMTHFLLWQAVEIAWLAVGTGWANSCLGCTNVVIKRSSHLVGASYWQWRQFGFRTGCLLAVSADYCKFVNEAWLRS